MNKINYDKELQRIVEENVKNGIRPKLLLHSCCAPCSSTCIERLREGFDLTIYYYNPNLDSDTEYNKRAKEQMRLCDELGIKYIIEEYNSEAFYSTVVGLEGEKEGGKRCAVCFSLRLKRTSIKAKENGYDFFATTLTLSPLKNAELINAIGSEIEKEVGVKYLKTDFKKNGGYLRSIELSKEYGLYRQNYCGCVFSKNG